MRQAGLGMYGKPDRISNDADVSTLMIQIAPN
jgi:hypothetical protein